MKLSEEKRRRVRAYWRLRMKAYKEREGLTAAAYIERVNRAMMWHGPYNYSDGDEGVCAEYGFDYLFPDAREMEGMGRKRFYFFFKKVDCTDEATVAEAFRTCKNYRPYLRVWLKHAPEELRSEEIFMASLVRMTVKGMRHEARVIEANGLRPATPEEDYFKGVDAYAGATPVQIKSPATERGMR